MANAKPKSVKIIDKDITKIVANARILLFEYAPNNPPIKNKSAIWIIINKRTSPTEIKEIIKNGLDEMPSFSNIPDPALSKLAEYVSKL